MANVLGLRATLNISTLFRELPFLRRPAAARAAGYDHVEAWWPWENAPVPSDAQADDFVTAVQDAGASLTGLNLFAGRLSGPDAGILSDPTRESEFADNLDAALGLGAHLGVRGFNTLYGNRLPGIRPELQDEVATARLAVASARAAAQGATILVEPLSGPKPYPLRTSADARDVVARVLRRRGIDAGSGQAGQTRHGIGWLCDLYHLAANGEAPEAVEADLRRHGHLAAHLQIADAPGRSVPGSGSTPLRRQVTALREAGYDALVGLEFIAPEGVPTPVALERMTFAP